MIFDDAFVEFPLGDVLRVLVDGELDGRPGHGRPVEAIERVMLGVGENEHLAVLAVNLRVYADSIPLIPLLSTPTQPSRCAASS